MTLRNLQQTQSCFPTQDSAKLEGRFCRDTGSCKDAAGPPEGTRVLSANGYQRLQVWHGPFGRTAPRRGGLQGACEESGPAGCVAVRAQVRPALPARRSASDCSGLGASLGVDGRARRSVPGRAGLALRLAAFVLGPGRLPRSLWLRGGLTDGPSAEGRAQGARRQRGGRAPAPEQYEECPGTKGDAEEVAESRRPGGLCCPHCALTLGQSRGR